MRHGAVLALLAIMLPAATAAADGFIEVAGGTMSPGGSDAWVDLAGASPKLALRAGSIDGEARSWRDWGDHIVSVDWTPIQTEVSGTSAHRVRALASIALSGHLGALRLGARGGLGLDFLRVSQSSESATLVGYAFEVGTGLWFVTGTWELGADLAVPLALNGNATVGDLTLDPYLSVDVDVLLGVRHVWR